MSSAAVAVDIQISNQPNLQKIENFLKDSSYRETIEFSANFNTRLCIERRLRLPFLDPQTGVAQNHSNLFMNERQRMPGFRQGQIYSYPSGRWRKSRRQYLSKLYRYMERPFHSFRREHGNEIIPPIAAPLVNEELNGVLLEDTSSLGAAGDTSDSKDSQQLQQQQVKEDLPKEWYYDDVDMNEMDSLEEPKSPADDEYDYDPRYGNKKRRKRRPGKKAMMTMPSDTPVRKGRQSTGASGSGISGSTTASVSGGGRGRGRRKARDSAGNLTRVIDPPSPVLQSEPPSFEMAAAAMGDGDHVELRNYRKYL